MSGISPLEAKSGYTPDRFEHRREDIKAFMNVLDSILEKVEV